MTKEQDMYKCDCNVIHEEVVERVRGALPDEHELIDLAELFKSFADSTRVRILWALTVSEMCVCDIAVLLNMTKSSISHQLRVLKQAKLVRNRKDGQVVFYSLADDHVAAMLRQGMEHVLE